MLHSNTNCGCGVVYGSCENWWWWQFLLYTSDRNESLAFRADTKEWITNEGNCKRTADAPSKACKPWSCKLEVIDQLLFASVSIQHSVTVESNDDFRASLCTTRARMTFTSHLPRFKNTKFTLFTQFHRCCGNALVPQTHKHTKTLAHPQSVHALRCAHVLLCSTETAAPAPAPAAAWWWWCVLYSAKEDRVMPSAMLWAAWCSWRLRGYVFIPHGQPPPPSMLKFKW